MNFLTHLFLADDTAESRIGNLLPDLCKPKQWQTLSPQIQQACRTHQQVDRLTDQHPMFRKLRSTLSPERRRFAGIILDVSFDHFIAREWQQWHHQPLNTFLSVVYRDFIEPPEPLPDRAQMILQRIAQDDWLQGYAHIDGIARAFVGLSRRFRFENPLAGAEQELLLNEAQWQQGFQQILADVRDQLRNSG